MMEVHPSEVRLLLALDRELDATDLATIDAHVRTCAECRATWDRLARLSDDELFRAWLYTDWDYGGLRVGHLRIPASQFTLAAIETGNAVLTPPVNPMNVAELVIWNNSGSPYYNARALRNRA